MQHPSHSDFPNTREVPARLFKYLAPIVALCASAALPPVSIAQPVEHPKPPPVRGAVEFDESPFQLDSVGLTMLLPLGARAEGSSSLNGKAAIRIQSADNTWFANLQTPRTSNLTLTSAQVLDDLVTQVLKQSGEIYEAGKPGNLLGYRGRVHVPRETVIINGRTAERAYVWLPGESNNPAFIRGYFVFQLSPSQYVTFELITTEPAFLTARREFEAMVTTASFEDPVKANADRAAAIRTGLKVFERVDETFLRQIIESQPERWERLFRPSPTGSRADDTEIGYRRIRTSIGRRADIDPSRKGTGPGDRQPGFVVAIDARYLDRQGDKTRIVDSQGIFYLSFDRTSEAWNVRNAIRDGKQTSVVSEIGARQDQTMSVEIIPLSGSGRSIRPILQGEGYISRVEALLLPQILIRAGITAEAGFYTYFSEKESVRLRRDLLEQPPERPGMWRITTRMPEALTPQVSIYNAKGELVHAELPRGVVAEPITLPELVSLWRSKNLPMD
jgi:hypothetical protein